MLHDKLTGAIIGAFYDVHRELGHGFLESVYERAMMIALGRRAVRVERQAPVSVYYDGVNVGDYLADLLVDNRVIAEVKASRAIDPKHEAQLLNYLRATSIEVGLLLHFAPQPAFRRLIVSNDGKMYRNRGGLPRRPAVDSCRLPEPPGPS